MKTNVKPKKGICENYNYKRHNSSLLKEKATSFSECLHPRHYKLQTLFNRSMNFIISIGVSSHCRIVCGDYFSLPTFIYRWKLCFPHTYGLSFGFECCVFFLDISFSHDHNINASSTFAWYLRSRCEYVSLVCIHILPYTCGWKIIKFLSIQQQSCG